ncbi:MAG TPA: carboxypeptidase regulatory-like domain-containing protein [Candidatus Acidoferrum sp.]|nr:carboxypeptidase regulatory-like domain-containing protein [Candidatus Acidoferrum sp.]
MSSKLKSQPMFSPPRLSARFTLLALVALFTLLLCSVAFAQTSVSNGSISGTVTDSTGAVVPNAKVTMTGTTGQTVHATTSAAGTYSSGALVPGAYSVRAEAKGFKTTQLDLDVQVNNTASGNIKLEIGQESTVVEVQGSEVSVNTEQAEVQGVLTASQIENLPVNGRNFLDLAQLEPGVQIQDGANFDPTKVGYSSISFGGRFGRTARINVDGIDVSDETVGTTTMDIPASAIQEFSLAQSSLDLSNDLTSSGAVNVTTKSGTNAFHGEAFGLFRDNAVGGAALPSPVDAATGTQLPTSYQRNQEGANIGGPILKNKLFFFADGERTLQHQQVAVPQSGPLDVLSGTYAAPFKEREFNGRLDYSLTKTARLFGRFNYFDNSVFATFFPTSYNVYNNTDVTRNDVAGLDFNTGSFTHTIRFSYLKFQNQIKDAVRGSSLPFANFPADIAVGSFTAGPNFLAPQSTPQSDHQIKYDGSKIVGKHILRYGFGFNHIQGGGFAKFFSIAPNINGSTPAAGSAPLGFNPADPTTYPMFLAIIGNGQGFSTTQPAFGFPAGGLGPDNRTALYFGDSWKVRSNLTVALGLRWERDTGRTDSDLPAIPELNAAFAGFGNPVHQPNKNFAPQLGIAWDPKGNGKTVVRAGIGLYYENVIYNNVLFDRPLRLKTGAFLQSPIACLQGNPQAIAGYPLEVGPDPTQIAAGHTTASACSDTIGNAASTIFAFQQAYQAANPFSLTTANPNYVATQLGNLATGGTTPGVNLPTALFAPNYVSPRAVQMNFGVQHEIRHGMVFSADFLRNVETRAPLGVDINHEGSIANFNLTNAQAAINNTITACGGSTLAGIIGPAGCPFLHPASGTNPAGSATISDFAGFGLSSSADVGHACQCAFGGVNNNYGQTPFLLPISRSVYNALQTKLTQNVVNPLPGVKAANFQISYSFSKFVNPMGFQGNVPAAAPVGNSDQDFVLSAADNTNPLKYMGPSLLDRTHQLSFGGSFEMPYGFRLGLIGHFYSPLSSPVVIGSTGTGGQIFQTDFTGSGVPSDPIPGTTNGSLNRQFGLNGLNNAIDNYNLTVAGHPTPAGQLLVSNGLFTASQLAAIGATPPIISQAPSDQLAIPWVRAMDFKLSWSHRFAERVTVEPSLGIYNLFNFTNYNIPPSAMNAWVDAGGAGSSVNSVHTTPQPGEIGPESLVYRTGLGTGVFGLGSPRVMEFGMRLTF